MKKFWIYGLAVVLLSTVLSWSNMRGGPRGYSSGGSSWSSSTGGGSWSSGGGGHK
ncbi:hypothetical protein IP91_03735 [Pseudoduganella lurida]|uniref:Uncharacterized protein n=1 Tax=Pseudoduganella lurida TaxID=1036180 RepID=A0A562R1H7_9BURK|nr:hypothetical protein [Pseudoduganella lurida]TWI62897.1 hypothetical protein IP91_03735 [Pseudoduganella lurida]